MKILITMPQDDRFEHYFPEHVLKQLAEMGEVVLNPHERQFTVEELKQQLSDTTVVLTHWGTPQLTAELLDCAPQLQLMGHCTGTVAHIASEAFYERGIPVLSANSIMAEYVAEAVVGYMIASCHKFLQLDQLTREDGWDRKRTATCQKALISSHVGLIGLGTIARRLLDMLAPFHCTVHVYDPYAKQETLERWPFARLCSFEEAMSQPIVSVHASQTPETYHMIDEKALKLLPDNGMLINSARGSLVDTDALIKELQTGRIYAALDVYEKEGKGNVPPELLALTGSTLLQPHYSCGAVTWEMTQGIVDDLRRFLNNEPMKLQVSLQQYRLMTQE